MQGSRSAVILLSILLLLNLLHLRLLRSFTAMKMSATIRGFVSRSSALLLLISAGHPAVFARPAQSGNHPAPVVRIPPSPARGPQNPTQPSLRPAGPPRGAHLGQWMQQHGNLSPQQQQRALQSEPGFNQLPPQTQQRLADRLNRLNSMPEQQRQRVISRSEAMERMTPQQLGDVRSVMGQLSSLPQDRRRMINRSFRELRAMPVAERNALLNSPGYRQQFSDEERGTLGNLLSVSPLLPDSR